MTKDQAITKLIRAMIAFGMEAEQINNSTVVVYLGNAGEDFVNITVGPVKR